MYTQIFQWTIILWRFQYRRHTEGDLLLDRPIETWIVMSGKYGEILWNIAIRLKIKIFFPDKPTYYPINVRFKISTLDID